MARRSVVMPWPLSCNGTTRRSSRPPGFIVQLGSAIGMVRLEPILATKPHFFLLPDTPACPFLLGETRRLSRAVSLPYRVALSFPKPATNLRTWLMIRPTTGRSLATTRRHKHDNVLCIGCNEQARVAELADALDSKSSGRKVVWVRVPPLVLSLSERRSLVDIKGVRPLCSQRFTDAWCSLIPTPSQVRVCSGKHRPTMG